MGFQEANDLCACCELQFRCGLGSGFRPDDLTDVDGNKDRVLNRKHLADTTAKMVVRSTPATSYGLLRP